MLCVSLYRFLRIIKNFSVKLTFAALPYSMRRPAPRDAGRRWRGWAELSVVGRYCAWLRVFQICQNVFYRKQTPKLENKVQKAAAAPRIFAHFFHKTCWRRLYYGQSLGLGPTLLYDLSTRRRFGFPDQLKRFLQKTKLSKKKTDHLRDKL